MDPLPATQQAPPGREPDGQPAGFENGLGRHDRHHACLAPRSAGSSITRNASPTTLSASKVAPMANAGAIRRCGKERIDCTPEAIIVPQLGVGGSTPTPM